MTSLRRSRRASARPEPVRPLWGNAGRRAADNLNLNAGAPGPTSTRLLGPGPSSQCQSRCKFAQPRPGQMVIRRCWAILAGDRRDRVNLNRLGVKLIMDNTSDIQRWQAESGCRRPGKPSRGSTRARIPDFLWNSGRKGNWAGPEALQAGAMTKMPFAVPTFDSSFKYIMSD